MKIVPTGLALSLFLAITFALFALIHYFNHSGMAMADGETMMGQGMIDGHHGSRGFLIGLGVSYALGWYAAFVFVPLYNFFNGKSAR